MRHRSTVTGALALLAWAALACSPGPAPRARLWTPKDFLAHLPQRDTLGGFPVELLVAPPSGPIPFRGPPYPVPAATQAAAEHGLTLYPAYASGAPSVFVLTDLWVDHPLPWLQPMWLFVSGEAPRDPLSLRIQTARAVFPVGPQGSFYSPLWTRHYVVAPDAGPETFRSAKEVLDARLPELPGPTLYASMVPFDVGLARAEGEPLQHPWTNEPVTDGAGAALNITPSQGWLDGEEVRYLGFGTDRARLLDAAPDETRLLDAPLYVFVSPSDGTRMLRIPPVLPPKAYRSSLMRRVDVALPKGAKIFVPAGAAELRAQLALEGADLVADASPDIPPAVARAHLLRVADNPSCFKDAATFPAGCRWLDSAEAIEARVSPELRRPTEVLLAVAALPVAGRVP